MTSNGKESLRTRVALILLEKFVLALIIAGAGFFLDFLLQEEKTRGDYQKQIFDQRVKTYIVILEEAKKARDGLALLYRAQGDDYSALGELGRREELDDLLQRSRWVDSGFGQSTRSQRGAHSHTPVIETLARLEQATRDNDLYISQHVKKCVDDFLGVVVSDLVTSLDNATSIKQSAFPMDAIPQEVVDANQAFRQAAWQRAEKAYQLLLEEVRNSLRVEGIPLG